VSQSSALQCAELSTKRLLFPANIRVFTHLNIQHAEEEKAWQLPVSWEILFYFSLFLLNALRGDGSEDSNFLACLWGKKIIPALGTQLLYPGGKSQI